MSLKGIFGLLETARFGCYAMSLDQRIVFWNSTAERILGHPADAVLGRHCYEVVAGLAREGLTPACLSGCPSIRSLQEDGIPGAVKMQMLCRSGERKTVWLTPMVVSGEPEEAPLLIHLFDDSDEGQASDLIAGTVRSQVAAGGADVVSDHPGSAPATDATARLTPRELQVLRLVALGWPVSRIAEELGISPHTVLNHVRNLRGKLKAATKLEAVLTALRQGILNWS